ncbi:uncharacterized protein METZ01_LOCUS353365, partial [marine metagenome]
MGNSLNNIGIVHHDKRNYDTALDYFNRSLAIAEELGNKSGMGYMLYNIGNACFNKGDLGKALDYFERSLKICEELGDKSGMGFSLTGIGGGGYSAKGDYVKALDYLEKSLSIQKEIGLGGELPLWTNTSLYISYKHLGRDYDEKEIHNLIKETEYIEFELNFRLYQLLEDTSYLETAYNQIQESTNAMEDDLKSKFLSYPIPKAIVEEWE